MTPQPFKKSPSDPDQASICSENGDLFDSDRTSSHPVAVREPYRDRTEPYNFSWKITVTNLI